MKSAIVERELVVRRVWIERGQRRQWLVQSAPGVHSHKFNEGGQYPIPGPQYSEYERPVKSHGLVFLYQGGFGS